MPRTSDRGDLRRHEAAGRHRPRAGDGAEGAVLDEPFGALDALTRAHLQDQVMEIHGKLGNTVMMITHDVDEAVLLSDRIVMMTNGPAAAIGDILEVPFPARGSASSSPTTQYNHRRAAVVEFLYARHKLAARGGVRPAMPERLIVVGNGMVGLRFVEELLVRAAGRYRLTVVGKARAGVQPGCWSLSSLLAGGFAEDVRFRDGVVRGARHQPRAAHAAESIDAAERTLRLADAQRIAFDRLVLATAPADPSADPGNDVAGRAHLPRPGRC